MQEPPAFMSSAIVLRGAWVQEGQTLCVCIYNPGYKMDTEIRDRE